MSASEQLLSCLPQGATGRAAEAQELLREHGLPTKKSERWRFTSLRGLADVPFAPAADTLVAKLPGGATWTDTRAPAISELRDFVAVNAAMNDVTRTLRIEADLDAPVLFHYRGDATHYPRVRIEVARGKEATLIERFDGKSALTCAVLEVVLEDGAALRHVRVHEDEGRVVSSVTVEQSRDSRYHSHVVTLGGALMRLDLDVRLGGPGASCDLLGAYHSEGADAIDHHVRVDHLAPHCSSNQDYRGLVAGRSTAVFDGQAIVHRSGPGAEAHQSNRNLLLSESANVFTKPHLEIDHEEVVASHGATVGALDESALFYLRSRGVPLEAAKAMLTFAFVRAIVDGVPNEALQDELRSTLRSRIPGASALPLLDGLEVDA